MADLGDRAVMLSVKRDRVLVLGLTRPEEDYLREKVQIQFALCDVTEIAAKPYALQVSNVLSVENLRKYIDTVLKVEGFTVFDATKR
ncbi:MAG: hypothetical protein A2845_03805 [Candidatus Lloydbacteria bacterium RIFCSPHIGHO2_01_FULL_49_22]|uniref:Uncharacterized protein n=1 Tax=Candidatus Lloydbacteria bacterium RIFCSPHIGHO2_01_FULL_49_22 TaxID=1798658 RepID=A0A1G2CZG4_9BACT|nr:MAG: hypothetical protein A2845_03805 [Candidatus Lloydbacteria bacterium RIFCSPHIGHO2_01_FULL_49_22]OGZ09051.1 MAG: hypothetical protein A3C14_03640 [Candidatus Lloydbacteria bacterium RIFCSPHIGHO2_02_FULL_50_18]